jgi:carboxyl-terminal processing protease
VWAEWKDGKAMIIDVRRDYGAWKAGIRPGMEVIAFNNIPVVQAASSYLPKSLERYDSTAHNYALNVLLAGIHSAERKITVLENKVAKERYPDSSGTITTYQPKELLEWKVLQGNVGYIRFNNSLGNNDLIPLFDTALSRLFSTSAMILDLRETPSGGNTTVARAIMSRFITKEGFYQKHVLEAEERQYGVRRSWQEIVSPRGKPYTKSLVVLVSHWTGSVGEGLAIGFDALKRATVVGTQMAGLNGGMYHYLMPNSRISLSLPVEQLYHINGTPREDFLPPKTVVMQGKEEDEILLAALRVLSKKK